MALDADLVIASVLYILTGILQIAVTFMLFKHFYGDNKKQRVSLPIRRTASLFAISCCLRMIFLVIHYIGLVTYTSTSTNHDHETYDLIISDWAGMASDGFLLISKIMLYWYLITRLKVTYKDSAYYPSNKILSTLGAFVGLIILITFILFIFFILYMMNKLPFVSNDIATTIFLVILMSTLMVSDFIISALILYSFINGLYQLIISLKQTVLMNASNVEILQKELIMDEEYANACAEFDASIDNDEYIADKPQHKSSIVSEASVSVVGGVEFIDMRQMKRILKQGSSNMCTQQEKLIQTITKNTLLSSIVIGSTFLFLVFRIVILMIEENNLIVLIYSVFGSLDATLDLCVIYLNFSFAKRWYFKLCFIFDNWCLNKCRNCAERGIYKANKQKYIYGVDNSYHRLN